MSDNFNNPSKYQDYNHYPMTLEKVMDIYSQHDIRPVRVELYYDFVNSLTELIFTTYLGDDVLTEKNKLEHFNWCWDKTVREFFEMGYDLGDMGAKYKYFRNFFLEIFYKVEDKTEKLEHDVLIVWEYIFNYFIIKPEKDVYNFIEIYKMFDNTNWFK